MKRFCRKCGAELEADALVCPTCGTVVTADEIASLRASRESRRDAAVKERDSQEAEFTRLTGAKQEQQRACASARQKVTSAEGRLKGELDEATIEEYAKSGDAIAARHRARAQTLEGNARAHEAAAAALHQRTREGDEPARVQESADMAELQVARQDVASLADGLQPLRDQERALKTSLKKARKKLNVAQDRLQQGQASYEQAVRLYRQQTEELERDQGTDQELARRRRDTVELNHRRAMDEQIRRQDAVSAARTEVASGEDGLATCRRAIADQTARLQDANRKVTDLEARLKGLREDFAKAADGERRERSDAAACHRQAEEELALAQQALEAKDHPEVLRERRAQVAGQLERDRAALAQREGELAETESGIAAARDRQAAAEASIREANADLVDISGLEAAYARQRAALEQQAHKQHEDAMREEAHGRYMQRGAILGTILACVLVGLEVAASASVWMLVLLVVAVCIVWLVVLVRTDAPRSFSDRGSLLLLGLLVASIVLSGLIGNVGFVLWAIANGYYCGLSAGYDRERRYLREAGIAVTGSGEGK